MAVQLPDFTSLSGQPTGIENVYPGNIQPSYPGYAPEAEALAQRGGALEKLGAGAQHLGTQASALAGQEQSKVNLANAALAQMDLHTNVARTRAAIDAETDPAKIDQLYSQLQDHLENASQLIPDEGYRTLWKAKHSGDVIGAQLDAEKRQRTVYTQNYDAGAAQLIDDAKKRYAQSDDPAVREQAANDLQTYYGGLRSIGVNPAVLRQHEQKAAQDMILGRSEYLYAQNRPQEALSNLTANLDKLPDTARVAGLAHTLRNAGSRANQLDIANQAWGGTDKGYAGSRGGGAVPAAVPPEEMAQPGAATADDPRGMIPVIRAAATAYGHDPDVAVKVAKSEGLTDPIGDGGKSGGALQLFTGGGLGNEFRQETGLDPLDPKNETATIYWAMQNLNRTGWEPYHGAQKVGVTPRQGVLAGKLSSADLAAGRGPGASPAAGTIPPEQGAIPGGTPTAPPLAGAPADVELPAVMVAASGPPAAAPIPTGAPSAAPAFPPLPDVNAMQQRIQDQADRGEISQEDANGAMSQVRSRFNHLQASQASDKRALTGYLTNTAAALEDGRDVDYNPAAVRHFFPAEQADTILQGLQDAKEGGQIVSAMRTSTQAEIEQQRSKLVAGLDEPGAPDYAKRRKILTLFDQQYAQRQKALVGPNADPVSYLNQYDPTTQQAAAAIDPKNPDTMANFANVALAQQARFGVPPEQQHVMTAAAAQRAASAIAADPEHAPDTMVGLANLWGPTAWPQVWSDLITAGKLPSGYQVVGQLADDPANMGNASLLARALGARKQDDAAFEKLIGTKAAGGKSIKDITNEIVPNDKQVQDYEHSLLTSNASPAQVTAIRAAIEHLAAARAIYLQEDPSEAAQKAIDAVAGHYRFMPNGGARVPADRFSDVSDNGQATLNERSIDNTAIPPRYSTGVAGEPKPQDYIDDLKAKGIWVTGPKADRLVMIDPGGRAALDRNGQRIEVPFALPGPPKPAAPGIPAMQVPY